MAYETDTYRGNRVVTAYYEDRTEAQSAVNRLVALGVPQAHVRLMDGGHSSGASATQSTSESSKGFFESLADFFIPDEDRHSYAEGLRRGGFVVSARVDEHHYEQALDVLDDDGTVDLSEREQSWRSEGWTGYDSSTSGLTGTSQAGTSQAGTSQVGTAGMLTGGLTGSEASRTISDQTYAADRSDTRLNDEEVIPVAEENLRVGKRDVNHGRVRVRSYVVEEPIHESVSLREESVDVERRPVSRAASGTDNLFEERTIEMEEHDEEAVVSKEARVTEEVVVRKDATERVEEVFDTVRRTKVEVDDERGTSRDTLRRG